MEIKIESATQFDNLLIALSEDVIDGELYFNLYKGINDSFLKYENAFNQSRMFWWLTRKSLIDSTLSRLCRVYDTHSNSLSLRNLLDTIKANFQYFDVDHFRERLKDNPFIETLAETARKPDINEINNDIASVSEKDTLVNNLIIWRHNIIAHKTAANIVDKINVTEKYSLTYNNISELLNRATTILNKYSGLFRASTYSTQAVGHDDYQSILDAVNYWLENNY